MRDCCHGTPPLPEPLLKSRVGEGRKQFFLSSHSQTCLSQAVAAGGCSAQLALPLCLSPPPPARLMGFCLKPAAPRVPWQWLMLCRGGHETPHSRALIPPCRAGFWAEQLVRSLWAASRVRAAWKAVRRALPQPVLEGDIKPLPTRD